MTVALALLVTPGAEGQPAGRVWRVGTLSAWPPSLREEAFRQGLRSLGYIEGQTVVIESRYADGRFERLPDLAAELVQLKVDVIVASPTEAIRAAQGATRTIPIVMAFSGDPVGTGLVTGLARPGGNVTGLSAMAPELTSKRLELLRAIAPRLSRVLFLANPATAKQILAATDVASRALGVQVTHAILRDPSELDRTFSAMTLSPVDGLVVDLVFQDRWRQIADLAIKSRLPAISGPREFAEAGGLVAYGP